jgi:mitosis inhibitor protein kinase SWE1
VQGLRFIHDLGVIHLDLKPANIFLTREGRFKIGDFGMASLWPRVSGGSPLGVGVGGFEREGDKVYLAREVLQGTYGKAADIFRYVFQSTVFAMTSHLTCSALA